MKKMKSNLDERQELTLLQIEHNGCWLAFWGLLLVLSVQLLLGNNSIGALAGEWAVFMCLALYLMIACIRNGIWDRKWKPNFKTNLLFSSIGALSAGIIWAAVSYRNYHRLAGSLADEGPRAALPRLRGGRPLELGRRAGRQPPGVDGAVAVELENQRLQGRRRRAVFAADAGDAVEEDRPVAASRQLPRLHRRRGADPDRPDFGGDRVGAGAAHRRRQGGQGGDLAQASSQLTSPCTV